MILDKLLEFDATGTAITVTAASTNVVDLGVARDMGAGDDPSLVIFFTAITALLSAGATTLTVDVQGSTDNSSWTSMVSTGAIGKASFTAGAKISLDVPRLIPGQSKPRYLRLNYTVATGPFTGGTIAAYMVLDDHLNTGLNNYGYAPGVTVSN